MKREGAASELTESELIARLKEANTRIVELSARLEDASNRILELETARLRAETLLAVTQVLGKTLSLDETIETILGELQRVVPYDSCSVQVIQGDRLVIVGGARPRRSRGPARRGLRPRGRDQPRQPGRAVEADSKSSRTFRKTRTLRARSTAVDAFAGGSALR